jgi:hypothetical protein
MGKSFKLKPQNNFKKKNTVEKTVYPLKSPYVKEKSNVIRPVYFDFNNYDEPPMVTFTMEPSALWGNDYINEINMNNFSDEE